MKKLVIATASLFFLAGIAAPVHASQVAAKKYPTCADLLKKYPNGVAKNTKAKNKAVKNGFAKPKVSKGLYKKNSRRLDKDKDDVMCEQDGRRSISFKTNFGLISTQSVTAPTAGECVSIPVTMDVRNLDSVGRFGMTVRLISEFGSVFAYEEISTSDSVPYPYTITEPGVFELSLKACGDSHAWTHPSGGRQEAVTGVKTDERIALVFYKWLDDAQLGSGEYLFL